MKKTYLSALLIGLTSTVGFSQVAQIERMHHIVSLEEGNGAPINNSPTYDTKVLGVEIWGDDFSTAANWTTDAVTDPVGGTIPANFGWNIGTTVQTWYTANGIGAGINASAGGFAELYNGVYTNATTGTQVKYVTYTMESPTFDIPNLPLNTSNTDGVYFSFKQFGALFNDEQTVEISLDGGATYEATPIFTNEGRDAFLGNNPAAIYANPESIDINVTPWTSGNASQVKFRFKWTSRLSSASPDYNSNSAWTTFGWFIDDVALTTLPTDELKLGKAWHGDIFNDWEYSMLPLSQAREMIAGVVVTNDAATTATAVVTCTVHDASGVVATPADISQSIASGVTDTIWFNTGFTPSANGVYHAEFSVPTDDIPTNNSAISSTLTVNDNLMAHDYGTSTSFGWSGTGGNSDLADADHAWGEIYTPTVTQDVYGMDVFLGTGTTDGAYILAQVFQINPLDDGSWIQQPLSNALTQVEINVAPANINALTNVIFPSPISLEAGKSYIFELNKADGTTGESFYIAGSSGNGEDDDNAAVGRGNYATDPTVDTYFNGWDGGFYIRPNFSTTLGLEETAMAGISVYPNPTQGKVTVNNTNNYNNTIEVVNVAGKVVYTETSNGNVTLDLTGNGAGVYFVNITNELGSITEKVILK